MEDRTTFSYPAAYHSAVRAAIAMAMNDIARDQRCRAAGNADRSPIPPNMVDRDASGRMAIAFAASDSADLSVRRDGVAIAAGDVKGRVPEHHADWFYDLRRKQNRVYGGLLRFIDTSAAMGTPREVIDQIPRLLASYIADVFEDRGRAA